MKELHTLQWIESTGGPLLLIEKNLLPAWCGYRFKEEGVLTDYERACKVLDYVGKVRIDDGYGLVLGEEPFATTWYQPNSPGIGLIVRWVCAENETAVINALYNLPDVPWEQTGVSLDLTTGDLILFDSSLPGTDIDDWLNLTVPRGSYSVETLHFQPDKQTSLILHRLLQHI